MLNVMRFTRLAIILLIVLTLSNCKKDSESAPNLLTSKTWKYGVIDKNPSTNPPGKNAYYAVHDCQMDHTFKFGSDGKLEQFLNNDDCGVNKTVITKTYTYNSKKKELWINEDKFTIAEESNSQIKYYIPITRTNGVENLIFLLQ